MKDPIKQCLFSTKSHGTPKKLCIFKPKWFECHIIWMFENLDMQEIVQFTWLGGKVGEIV